MKKQNSSKESAHCAEGMTEKTRGTLKLGEYHPSADFAMQYIRSKDTSDLFLLQEAFASCAIENNRLAEICGDTLNRVLTGAPVSDRYLLGLAWYMQMIDKDSNA